MITQEYLKEIFDYVDGKLIWKWRNDLPNNLNARYAGKEAGVITPTARYIRVNKIMYLAHRLVWLYYYGEPIPKEIDHKDTDPLNNRIDNLREATRSQNRANANAHNIIGIKGVSKVGSKWVVYVKANGRNHYGGTFDTIEKATKVSMTLREQFFGEFARV